MRRRDFLNGVAAAVAARFTMPSGQALASEWSIPFGVAIQDGALREDAAYRAALIEHCQLLVGEGGLKWFDVRPAPGHFIFDQPDRVLEFASQNGMQMRGHTLCWYAANPDWVMDIRGEAEAERHLLEHIEMVVTRYRGRVPSWDVVNEPISEDPRQTGRMRESVWQAALGEKHVEIALRMAAQVDPDAQLVINEYDIEFAGEPYAGKRQGLLDLVRDLKDRDVPLHAVGLQGHLRGELEIDKEGVSAFVDELARMDVDVLVTEMDVIDNYLPGPEDERDAAVAALATDFLGAIFDAAPPKAILTWGISDRYTWVPIWFTRGDGRPNRPLPLDHDYRPKDLMAVINDFRR